jgi:hypothetical protein
MKTIWRLLRGMLLALAAVGIFLEEWGWRPLTALAARLAQWPPIRRLEARLADVSPKTALLLFLAPAVLLFPIKLLALWLIHQGRSVLGIGLIVLAKLVGTALVGRLFILTESKLIQFKWFAKALTWWRMTKQRVMLAVHSSHTWQGLRRARERVKAWARRF